MRVLAVALVGAVMIGLAIGATNATAAEHAPAQGLVLQSAQATPVPSHDDTRVGVQVGVVVAAAVAVVIVGTAAYFIRKRLGLVSGPPEQPPAGHH
jgi:hypothetical protein